MSERRWWKAVWSSVLVSLGLRVQAQELRTVAIDSVRSIFQIVNFQSSFVSARNVDLYIPPDYDSLKTYRLLIMQDGQNLFCPEHAFQNEVLGLDLCMERNQIRDVIIAGVWNTTDRFREYLPNKIYHALKRKDRKLIRNEYGGPALGDPYLQFIKDELIPYLRSRYPISNDPKDIVIGGISMGALIAFYAAIQNPDIFGSSLCLSTHWPLSVMQHKTSIEHAYLPVLHQYISGLKSGSFYFDRGDENIDAWYEHAQKDVDDWMKRTLPNPDQQLMSRVFKASGHEMKDWSARIDVPVRFIFINGE